MAVIAVSFIMIGNLNALAPIVTMPFLLTYAAIDYAYFKLAMSYDIRQKQKLVQQTRGSPEAKLISSKENVHMRSYGSNGEEKHDFGDLNFSNVDATEKDDSQEKEKLKEDDSPNEFSPLDVADNKGETKAIVYHKPDTSEDVFDADTLQLLEKEKKPSKIETSMTKMASDVKNRKGMLLHILF